MQKRIISALVIVLALLMIMVPGGCTRQEIPEDPSPGTEEPLFPEPDPGQQPDPDPGQDELPLPEPGPNEPEPPPAPQVLALDITEIRTLELEPTARDIRISRQYIAYYVPANVEVLQLTDIFDADYTLPTPEFDLPTSEGAVWWGNRLYYLSRNGWFSDEPMDPVFFAYSPDSHTAKDYQLNFPDSFSPQCFFVDWNNETRDVDAIFVGETGSYQFSLATGAMEKLAEFSLDLSILDRAVWHPDKPLLTYSDGSQLKLVDVLTGEESVLYEASGEIAEFCWNEYGDAVAALTGGRLEIISDAGQLRQSLTVSCGAYSLGWVPLLDRICYLIPAEGNALPTLVIEDRDNNLRYIHQGCTSYAWTWTNKLWTYSEASEQDAAALICSHIHWNPNEKEAEIPYVDEYTGLESPKLPITQAPGDFEEIAEELFIVYMENLNGETAPENMRITDYVLHSISFRMEELWGFRVYVAFSVQSPGDYYIAGNGVIGEDGWVNHKEVFINIYKDQEFYIMGQDWSTSP